MTMSVILLLKHNPYDLHSSVVFLLHIALEIPVAIQGVWSPQSLPFLQMNNTAVLLLKVSRLKSRSDTEPNAYSSLLHRCMGPSF